MEEEVETAKSLEIGGTVINKEIGEDSRILKISPPWLFALNIITGNMPKSRCLKNQGQACRCFGLWPDKLHSEQSF